MFMLIVGQTLLVTYALRRDTFLGTVHRNSKKVGEVNPIQTEVMQIQGDIREEGMLVIKARTIVKFIRGLDQGLRIL